jgi:hypothetical protein
MTLQSAISTTRLNRRCRSGWQVARAFREADENLGISPPFKVENSRKPAFHRACLTEHVGDADRRLWGESGPVFSRCCAESNKRAVRAMS